MFSRHSLKQFIALRDAQRQASRASEFEKAITL